jgi:hypothetical protein
VESPESWFEDFGEAQLVDGKATVPLDPEFASIVKTDAYHVFLTPYGDSNGLYVSRRNNIEFQVSEHQGGRAICLFHTESQQSARTLISQGWQRLRCPSFRKFRCKKEALLGRPSLRQHERRCGAN